MWFSRCFKKLFGRKSQPSTPKAQPSTPKQGLTQYGFPADEKAILKKQLEAESDPVRSKYSNGSLVRRVEIMSPADFKAAESGNRNSSSDVIYSYLAIVERPNCSRTEIQMDVYNTKYTTQEIGQIACIFNQTTRNPIPSLMGCDDCQANEPKSLKIAASKYKDYSRITFCDGEICGPNPYRNCEKHTADWVWIGPVGQFYGDWFSNIHQAFTQKVACRPLSTDTSSDKKA